MGCAIILDDIGIELGSVAKSFNGAMLKKAREFDGYTLEELAELTGIRYHHLLEIEEGLRQPSRYDMNCIMKIISSFLESFYFCKTFKKDKPDVIFVCGEGIKPCSNCGGPADYLCDYPVGEGKTCSLPICNQCRTHIGKYDFCPVHGEANKVIGRF